MIRNVNTDPNNWLQRKVKPTPALPNSYSAKNNRIPRSLLSNPPRTPSEKTRSNGRSVSRLQSHRDPSVKSLMSCGSSSEGTILSHAAFLSPSSQLVFSHCGRRGTREHRLISMNWTGNDPLSLAQNDKWLTCNFKNRSRSSPITGLSVFCFETTWRRVD